MIGQALSHYRILAKLGEGGMGTVYRAEDLELGRQVALKLLPREVAADQERLERFRREARTLAALDHPNIVTIYSVESAEGIQFLTMQLIEGDLLRDRIPKSGLPPYAVLEMALSLADALAEAHESGVIHRDLKPSNVVIDRRDRVKILDFGLAKLYQTEESDQDESIPTDLLTSEGLVMGTLPYMSPEQVAGKPIDQRSDLFSFGSMLYEMVSGARPFKGESSAHVIAAILRDEPKPLAQPDLPHRLRLLIERCLEKDLKRRFQSAHDILRELEAIQDAVESGSKGILVADSGAIPATPVDKSPSIAVLPFANLSADPDNEFFSDGLAEELINALTKIEGLKVPARTSSFRFKGRTADVREIGRDLGVATVLQGSVRRSGEQMRISAQLIDVNDGYHLWTETFDCRFDNIFAIQDEVARSIVDKFEVELASTTGSGPIKRYTTNPQAYEHYLKGRFSWNRRDQGGLQMALEQFEKAIEVDPDYALAKVGLADVHHAFAVYSLVPPMPTFERVVQLVEEALAIAPHLGEAYATRGAVHMVRAQWQEAEDDYLTAIDLAPSYSYTRALMTNLYGLQSRKDDLDEQAAAALELEPDSHYLHFMAGVGYHFCMNYERAIDLAEKGLELDPTSFPCRWLLGLGLLETERTEEAVKHLEAGVVSANRHPVSLIYLGYAYGRVGRVDRVEEIQTELEQRSQDSYVHPIAFAFLHHGKGELEEARHILLEEAKKGMPASWVGFHDPRVPELYDFYGLPFPKRS